MIRRFLALLLSAPLACATGATGRPPEPPSPHTVQAQLGYRDVVQAGEEYARSQGYALAEGREALEVRPHYWLLRFRLAEKHSGKLLSLELDGASRQVVREQVLPESSLVPVSVPHP